MTRRRPLLLAGAVALLCRPARATPTSLQTAITAFTGGAAVRDGRVRLDIAPLVENGNAVPVSLGVEGTEPGGVRRLALFNEQNPQPDVAVFRLGALVGRAQVSTRMRLATSQTVVALAELADGSFWQHRVEVVVTLAACVEGE